MTISKSGYCALVWVPALVSILIVSTRLYVRFKSRILGTDDYLMLISAGLFLCYAILNQVQQSARVTSPLEAMQITTLSTMASVIAILSLSTGRTSVGYLLLRIVPSSMRGVRWFIGFTLGGLWILTFLFTMGIVFPSCSAGIVALGSAHTKGCLDLTLEIDFVASLNWYGVFVDLAFTLLPALIVSRLQIKGKGMKIALLCLLSLGLFATIFLILRASSAYADWSSATINVIVPVATSMEQALIIIGGSLVTLMPLYRLWSLGIAITPRHSPQSPTYHGESRRPFAGNHSVTTMTGSQDNNISHDVEKPDGIFVERDFRVTSDQADGSLV